MGQETGGKVDVRPMHLQSLHCFRGKSQLILKMLRRMDISEQKQQKSLLPRKTALHIWLKFF